MSLLTFVGTGEATDPDLPNTSLLYRGSLTVLLDCGYSVPPALWRMSADPDLLDAVWISHRHADHTFGLPAVLLAMRLAGRTRPLRLLGAPGTETWLRRLLRLSYPGVLTKALFPIEIHVLRPRAPLRLGGVTFRVARTAHSLPNLAIRIDDDRSIAYSGDGAPTPASRRLYEGVDLLVHECFWPERPSVGHAGADELLPLVREADVGRLAIVHVAKEGREALTERINRWEPPPVVLLPSPGDTLEV